MRNFYGFLYTRETLLARRVGAAVSARYICPDLQDRTKPIIPLRFVRCFVGLPKTPRWSTTILRSPVGTLRLRCLYYSSRSGRRLGFCLVASAGVIVSPVFLLLICSSSWCCLLRIDYVSRFVRFLRVI